MSQFKRIQSAVSQLHLFINFTYLLCTVVKFLALFHFDLQYTDIYNIPPLKRLDICNIPSTPNIRRVFPHQIQVLTDVRE